MDIRKFIKEEIEKTLNKKELEKKFDQDISYLNGFSLLKKENKGTSTIWVFEHKEKINSRSSHVQCASVQKDSVQIA